MDALKFLKTKERMCKYFETKVTGNYCKACPLYSFNGKPIEFCNDFIISNPEQAIDIIEKWSEENPTKTRKTEDVEPVIHGYWTYTDAYPHWMCCSVCHKKFVPNMEWIGTYNIPSKYCPNCGAKMDDESEIF